MSQVETKVAPKPEDLIRSFVLSPEFKMEELFFATFTTGRDHVGKHTVDGQYITQPESKTGYRLLAMARTLEVVATTPPGQARNVVLGKVLVRGPKVHGYMTHPVFYTTPTGSWIEVWRLPYNPLLRQDVHLTDPYPVRVGKPTILTAEDAAESFMASAASKVVRSQYAAYIIEPDHLKIEREDGQVITRLESKSTPELIGINHVMDDLIAKVKPLADRLGPNRKIRFAKIPRRGSVTAGVQIHRVLHGNSSGRWWEVWLLPNSYPFNQTVDVELPGHLIRFYKN